VFEDENVVLIEEIDVGTNGGMFRTSEGEQKF
jgi:pyruvate/2-oxoglutarate/acetoin dehydrogenase E1 component